MGAKCSESNIGKERARELGVGIYYWACQIFFFKQKTAYEI